MSDLTLNKQKAQQMNMGQAEALLKKQEKKQADVAKVQMEREQFFTTYKKDQQESFQKENIFSKYNKLDSEVFPAVLNDIKKDREKYPDSDLDLKTFIKQERAQLSDTLDAIDLKQKSTRYKNVYGYENNANFNFKDSILSKELLESLAKVEIEDRGAISASLNNIEKAIDQCDVIKDKALQHVSNENFKTTKTEQDEKIIKAEDAQIELLGNLFDDKILDVDCNDKVISKIRYNIFHNEMKSVLEKEKKRRDDKFKSKKPDPHVVTYYDTDENIQTYTFNQNLQTIIKNCQIKEDGSLKNFKNAKELRAFVDEMTVSIAQVIADFCAVKYNIDKGSEGYRQLLIGLIAQNQFYKENKKDRVNTLNLSALGINLADQTGATLETIGFNELFEDKERLLNSLIRARDFSAEVLTIEENRDYKIAGRAQGTDLIDSLKITKTIVNSNEIEAYKIFAKELDAHDGYEGNDWRLEDPQIQRNHIYFNKAKSDILAKDPEKSLEYNNTKASEIKLSELLGADKLKNALNSKKELVYDDNKEFNLLTRKQIKEIGKKLSDYLAYAEAPVEKGGFGEAWEKMYDYKGLYNAISKAADFMNAMVTEKFQEISVEKGVQEKVEFKIDNKKIEELISTKNDLWLKMFDMIGAAINYYKHDDPLIGALYSKGKLIRVEDLMDRECKDQYVNALRKQLVKSEIFAVYSMAYKGINQCEKAVTDYRKSLEKVIDKKSDVSDYYNGVSQVRGQLVNLRNRIWDSDADEKTIEDIKKAEDFKKRFQALREKQIVEPKSLKKDEVPAFSREEAKINLGKEIYNLLKEFDTFKTYIAENESLGHSFVGRKLIEDVMKIQQEQSERLVAEKKEELAYYEGNLLKMEINDFQRKNQNFGRDMKEDAAKKKIEFVNNYMPLKEKMTAYLDRYAELKNSTYYVKQVAVVQEAVERQLKAMATDKLFQVYNLTMEDQDVAATQLQFDYSTEANLSKRYKGFVAKLKGDDKFGDYKDDVELSNKADELLKMDISEEELKSGLDCMFSLSVVSERMIRGGMDISSVMHNMGLPGNVSIDLIDQNLLKKVKEDKKLQNIAKTWFTEKANKLREAWSKVLKAAERESVFRLTDYDDGGNGYDMAITLGHYIATQSPVAIQLEMLHQIGQCAGFEEISQGEIKTSVADINADITKYKADGKIYGLASQDKEIHQADALKAYHDLKVNNNITTVIEIAKNHCVEDRDKALDGIEHKTITKQLENFEAIRSLRDKPSKYFAAVDDAMKAVAEFEAIDYKSISNKELEKKITGHKAAFEALIKATSKYIETRDTWNHAFWEDGKKRLKAIKEIHKVALANLNYFERYSKYIVDEHVKADPQRALELREKLKKFKENPPQGNQLEEFNRLFAAEIHRDCGNKLFDTKDGVELYVELHQEQDKIKKSVVKEIIANVERIKYECAKKDVTAGRRAQFTAWAHCYNYYNKFEKNCPEEAKEALESLRTLSREYFNAKEAETILQEINRQEVKDLISKYSMPFTKERQYTPAQYADMMRLIHKYNTFIAGVAEVCKYTKDISFIPEYGKFVSNFNEMKKRAQEYFESDDNMQEVIKQSKIQLDEKISDVRGRIKNFNYVLGDIDTEVAQHIKEALEQIAYFFSLYSKGNMEPAFIEYYGAQRSNLQNILSANPTRMLLTDDYGINFDVKKEAATGYIAASDKMMPVDQRLETYLKEINENPKNADATNEKKIAIRADSINKTIKYIVSVETEKNLLGGVAKVNKTSPEMANVLERQLAVRSDFEARLKNRGKNKDKEDQDIRDAALKSALVNAAGDYFELLHKKEISISEKNLPTEQERLMYYFVSFSKNFDEAKVFLDIVRTWQSVYGFDVRSTNLVKLEDIVSRINFKTKETLQYNNLTQADQDTKDKINHMKQEAVLAQYSTKEVCDRRDADFAYTIQNLGDLKLNSVKSFRENDFVKAKRRFNGAENYKNLKVEKSWNITIFGFTFFGKVDRSINDYAKRLLHYSKLYPELINPMTKLIQVKGYAKCAILDTDRRSREEALSEFNKCIQSINKDIIIATSEAAIHALKSDSRIKKHKSDADLNNVRKGWLEFYNILKELKLQIHDYMERHPFDEKKDVNAEAKVNHVRFSEAMKEMTSGETTVEAMEKRLFKILQYSNENKYAESAFEHSANVEYSMYRNFLTSWFENYCFEQADVALKAISLDKFEVNVNEHYKEFLEIIEKYDASHAISKDTYKYLKNRVLEACKAKFENFKDLPLEERAQLRADVVYKNVLSFLGTEKIMQFTVPPTREQLSEAVTEGDKKVLNFDFNGHNVKMAHYIQHVAYQAAMLEARSVKVEENLEASERAMADSLVFLESASDVLKSEGGWWFVLKDYVQYAVGKFQAGYYKACEAKA